MCLIKICTKITKKSILLYNMTLAMIYRWYMFLLHIHHNARASQIASIATCWKLPELCPFKPIFQNACGPMHWKKVHKFVAEYPNIHRRDSICLIDWQWAVFEVRQSVLMCLICFISEPGHQFRVSCAWGGVLADHIVLYSGIWLLITMKSLGWWGLVM